jgi:hypothetical protein
VSSQENIRVARRILEEGFGGGDLAVIDELVREDFVEHQHGAEGIGTEAVKRIIRGLHGSFTDMHLDIKAILADSDTVWVRSRARATNTLPFRGRPPTGRTI